MKNVFKVIKNEFKEYAIIASIFILLSIYFLLTIMAKIDRCIGYRSVSHTDFFNWLPILVIVVIDLFCCIKTLKKQNINDVSNLKTWQILLAREIMIFVIGTVVTLIAISEYGYILHEFEKRDLIRKCTETMYTTYGLYDFRYLGNNLYYLNALSTGLFGVILYTITIVSLPIMKTNIHKIFKMLAFIGIFVGLYLIFFRTAEELTYWLNNMNYNPVHHNPILADRMGGSMSINIFSISELIFSLLFIFNCNLICTINNKRTFENKNKLPAVNITKIIFISCFFLFALMVIIIKPAPVLEFGLS